MARPAKLNDETVKTIVDAIKVGCPIRVACQAAGIGLTTFKSWMIRGKSTAEIDAPFRAFRAALKKARSHGETYALGIIQAAMPDHWQAAAWFLERSKPRRWGRIDRLNAVVASGQGGSCDVKIYYDGDLKTLSDDELDAVSEGKADLVLRGKAHRR